MNVPNYIWGQLASNLGHGNGKLYYAAFTSKVFLPNGRFPRIDESSTAWHTITGTISTSHTCINIKKRVPQKCMCVDLRPSKQGGIKNIHVCDHYLQSVYLFGVFIVLLFV